MARRYPHAQVVLSQSDNDPTPLVLAAQNSDASAMESLLARYSPLVRHCARCYLSGADRDDLLQQGFLILVELVHEYDAGRGVPFGSYLLHKLPWRLCHYVRDRLSPLGREETFEDETPAVPAGFARPAFSNDEQVTDTVSLEMAFVLLTPQQQRVLRLRYWDDLTVLEIAQGWGVSPQGVRRLLARAEARLKAALDGHETPGSGV